MKENIYLYKEDGAASFVEFLGLEKYYFKKHNIGKFKLSNLYRYLECDWSILVSSNFESEMDYDITPKYKLNSISDQITIYNSLLDYVKRVGKRASKACFSDVYLSLLLITITLYEKKYIFK